MENVICGKCQSVNDYNVVEKANNKVAYCNKCEAYIKNIPYDTPKLYVGKYKGKPITEIEDLQYLKWAFGALTLTATARNALNKQISHLEFLAQ